MRSHEERVEAVKQRIVQTRRQQLLRRNRIITGGAAAACLALIAGLSAMMPAVLETAGPAAAAGLTTASIFGSSEALGYILVGLLSFVLGACFTILCFSLRRFQQEEAETEERDGGAHR